jgi:hypothetical protein
LNVFILEEKLLRGIEPRERASRFVGSGRRDEGVKFFCRGTRVNGRIVSSIK